MSAGSEINATLYNAAFVKTDNPYPPRAASWSQAGTFAAAVRAIRCGSPLEQPERLGKADRLDAAAHRERFVRATDDKAAFGIDILAGVMKAAFQLGRATALDFQRPWLAASGQFEHQIDFRTCGAAVEGSAGSFREIGKDIFDDKSLPACAHAGETEEIFHGPQAEQVVENAAVAQINPR